MSERVSQREYARRVGVQPSYINRLVANGVIKLVDNMVDVDEANAQWHSSRTRSPKRPDVAEATRATTGDKMSLSVASVAPSQIGYPPADSLTAARARRERALAEQAERENLRRSGELTEITAVQRGIKAGLSQLREDLLSLPAQLHTECVGKDARAIYTIIDTAMRQALTKAADTLGAFADKIGATHQ